MKTIPIRQICLLAATLIAITAPLSAQPAKIPDGTAEATKAIARFKVPPGFKVDLWAAEPMLGQPVAFCIDEKGRIFVAETYRFNRGTEEYRHRPFFLEGDLSNTSVDDRLAMFQKFESKFNGGMSYFSKYSDKIRLLEDRAGKGRADHSSIFADGFNDPLDGLAAGVLAKDGDVYFTCIPKLWKLRDSKGVGKADVKQALHHGFGPMTAFLGHDLHGLVFGPDGKLYFSVGDRGYHVKNKEGKTLSGPRQGAVFRCDPDGANLEVVHTGLRNPQELAFDQFGNLFAADNNCDKGDHSRLVYIVEGGQSGWNMAFQTIGFPPAPPGSGPGASGSLDWRDYPTGPWHAEKLWHLQHPGQAAYIVPPVGKLGAGPSGFTFTSGLGWPKRYQDAFFMCNFTGNGGVDSFRVVPKGAAYELVDYHTFLNPVSATDVDFGYDGKMYLSDWVQFVWDGGGVGKGRIYTVADPKALGDPVLRKLAKLMHDGFKNQPHAALLQLLAHPDMRVRLRAQYELADRGPKDTKLNKLALGGGDGPKDLLPRLHALWALGQMARKHPEAISSLAFQTLLNDPDAEMRAQAVKLLGDIAWSDKSWPGLALTSTVGKLIDDDHPRVRYFAMQSAGKLKIKEALPRIFAQIFRNQDEDAYLRHAAVMALVHIGDVDAVLDQARLASEGKLTWGPKSSEGERAIRLAAVLTLRTLGDARLARFLNDADELVVTEAARAINDLPIAEAMPALARLGERYGPRKLQPGDALWRRIINANFRLGQVEHAQAVLAIADNKQVPEVMRQEALVCLTEWGGPGKRDRVNGYWRPLADREAGFVKIGVEERLPSLLASSSAKVQTDVTRLIVKLNLKTDESTFLTWVNDKNRPAETRVAALDLLAARKSAKLLDALKTAHASDAPLLRARARERMLDADEKLALVWFGEAMRTGTTYERQQMIRLASRARNSEIQTLARRYFDLYEQGTAPAELKLDIIEAARSVDAPLWKKFEEERKLARTPEARLKIYGVTLQGGDSQRGRQIFASHPVAQCIRCHKAAGQGGDAGPDLSAWAPKAKGDRGHFLESLLYPSKKFTPGFGVVVLTLTDGRITTGTIRTEDKEKLTLVESDGKVREIPIRSIEERANGISPMPEMGPVLTMEEIRDLIEYLATLR